MKRLVGLLALLVGVSLPGWADAAFPIIRCVAINQTTTNTTAQPIPNANCADVGDLIIVTAGIDGTNSTTWPAATYCVGNAFTVLQADAVDTANAHTHSIRYCILDAVMSGTNNITTNSEQSTVIVAVILKDSFVGTPEIGTVFIQSTADTVVDPPSLTPSWGAADTLWIISVADDGTGRPSFTAGGIADQLWGLNANYNSAGSTGAGAGMFFRFENVASLDPANTIFTVTSNEHSENTIAIKGQAIPSGGTTKPPCVISFHDEGICRAAFGD